MDLHVSMIINKKKKKKSSGKVVKEIIELIEEKKVEVVLDNTFETELDVFLLSYLKLNKLIDQQRETIENLEISQNILDEIVSRVEENDFIIPDLQKKKIFIKEQFLKHTKKSDIKIEMVYENYKKEVNY
tara:strand:+ start:1389 stop:1778 length:390 start_codon:yes stop_codon:yes gene_type:complete